MLGNACQGSPRLRSGQALRLPVVLGAFARRTILAQDDKTSMSPLRMTRFKILLNNRRICVGWFFFVGVDFAVVFGVERSMLGIEMVGRHG